MKVFITGAGGLLGQGLLRSLFASSLAVTPVAFDPEPLGAGLYWTSQRSLIPYARDPDFTHELTLAVEREKPDAILIGSDVELPVVAPHRERLERDLGVQVVVSSPEVVGIADDKYLTYEFLREHGFDAPRTCLAGEEDALVAKFGYPVVVKPRQGARSVGVTVARDRGALDRAIAEAASPVVVQEYLPDERSEFTAGALVFDGRCDASIVMRRELRDGNTFRAFTGQYPEYNRLVREMAETLGPHGPVNFQFRVSEGRARVFEINARFSGTTPIRAMAGFNEVEMTLRKVVLGEPVIQPEIEEIVVLRHLSATVVRQHELLTPLDDDVGPTNERVPRT
jgi:carbamoyl-phosphate synthase large subunit